MPPSRLLIGLGLSLSLAGCAGSATPTLLTEAGALGAFRALPNSARAPCVMQRAVAEHNSAYDSLKQGREVVYKAPCDVDKPPPKTS